MYTWVCVHADTVAAVSHVGVPKPDTDLADPANQMVMTDTQLSIPEVAKHITSDTLSTVGERDTDGHGHAHSLGPDGCAVVCMLM